MALDKAQSITLAKDEGNINMSKIFFVQGDVDVYPLTIYLTDGGKPFPIPDGTAFYPSFLTARGVAMQGAACEIVDAENGVLRYRVSGGEIAVAGDVSCAIEAVSQTQKLTFQRFSFKVLPAIAAPPPNDKWLTSLRQDILKLAGRLEKLEEGGGQPDAGIVEKLAEIEYALGEMESNLNMIESEIRSLVRSESASLSDEIQRMKMETMEMFSLYGNLYDEVMEIAGVPGPPGQDGKDGMDGKDGASVSIILSTAGNALADSLANPNDLIVVPKEA